MKFRKYFAEAIGTFALVFAGCGAIVVDEIGIGNIGHLGVSMVFGLVIMAMIYSYGNISGAHFNPAVTVSFLAARRISLKDAGLYIAAQIIGAVLAAAILRFMFPGFVTLGVTAPSGNIAQSFVLEMLLAFFLMTVILNVSTGHMEKGIMAGISIGAAVFIAAVFGGPVSGASINPARSLGPALLAGNYSYLWIYMTAPVLGTVMAVPAFHIIHKKIINN
jgi:aquaporin Z